MGCWLNSRTTCQVWPAPVLRSILVRLRLGVPLVGGHRTIAYRTPGALPSCSTVTNENDGLCTQVTPASVLFQNPLEPPWRTAGFAGSISSSKRAAGGGPSRVQVSPPSVLLRRGPPTEPTAA